MSSPFVVRISCALALSARSSSKGMYTEHTLRR